MSNSATGLDGAWKIVTEPTPAKSQATMYWELLQGRQQVYEIKLRPFEPNDASGYPRVAG